MCVVQEMYVFARGASGNQDMTGLRVLNPLFAFIHILAPLTSRQVDST